MGKMLKGGGEPLQEIKVTLEISAEQAEKLLKTLQSRFEKNMQRHLGLEWSKVQAKLQAHPNLIYSLNAMESTGGEPDVVGYDEKTGEFLYYDCSAETPSGRRSICYDSESQNERERKGVHPAGNVVDLAAAMGIDILTEDEYCLLQKLGHFDTKTESWVKTPPDVRKLGGAIFCDRCYDRVFTFHNSAGSFYAGRGFRGLLRV